jgi:hypothetical protein
VQKRQERKTSRVPENGHSTHGGSGETSATGQKAGGIPEEFFQNCEQGDVPIYCCDHCRQNGTFDPSRYSFKTEAELKGSGRIEWREFQALDEAKGHAIRHMSGSDFLSDREIRQILEGLGVTIDRDPVNEALQRNRFRKGRGLF